MCSHNELYSFFTASNVLSLRPHPPYNGVKKTLITLSLKFVSWACGHLEVEVTADLECI